MQQAGLFLERLRRAETGKKRRWLFLSSGTAMVVVLVLWAVYVRATIPSVGPVFGAETGKGVAAEAAPGFARTFLAGVEVLAGQAYGVGRNVLDFFSESLGAANQITIEPAKRNFIPEGLPLIRPTDLP